MKLFKKSKIKKEQNAFERKVDFADLVARRMISLGGYGIIIVIVFILLFLVYQSLPLSLGAKLKQILFHPFKENTEKILLAGTDEYQEIAYTLNEKGILRFYKLDAQNNSTVQLIRTDSLQLNNSEQIISSKKGNLHKQVFSSATNKGRFVNGEIYFRISFEGDQRLITPEFELFEPIIFDTTEPDFKDFSFVQNENGEKYWAVITENNQVFLHTIDEDETTLFSGHLPLPLSAFTLSTLAFNQDANILIAGTDNGYLLWYDLSNVENINFRDQWKASSKKITALSFLLGNEALIVGDDNGDVATWFRTRTPDNIMKFLEVHQFESHDTAVNQIYPSPRDRNFVSIDVEGKIHLNYSTTSKTQLEFAPSEFPIQAGAITPKSDGIVLIDQDNRFGWFQLANPHPEATLNSLFGKVWYENYPKPEFVWQSTGGSDEFESKLSLIPLIFGTIKGTLYAMFFSIPLAILAAIYVSQFAPVRLARVVKPTVEIMAALPSVVIGFLAGLYFSPLFEKYLLYVLLVIFVIPLMIILAVIIWRFIPEQTRMKVPLGWELLYLFPIVVLGFWFTSLIDQTIEMTFFSGDFKQWLYTALDVTYDTRNSLVVGFALGFAVIPIIFTVAEDALSNVPPSLTTASMALGASRWQTVRKIVIPAASGGIFAGIMLGFGRAIGETMIVLMATGNTPILDLSPFNGFRAMSASIAVEIPEAPVGGTLYRVLFLTALLLFIFTFVLNSVAALIGDKLRKKYARF